ncbi:MAG: hypothetical protein C4551_02840 [Bacillota bacterium]|nr:MAG: hypothetical protein C4551_02840 [Bacillota bacterium]
MDDEHPVTHPLVARVADYVDACNRHDVDAVLGFYTTDVRFELVGAWVRQGRDELRRLAEYDKGTNCVLSMVNPSVVASDTVEVELVDRNDWFGLVGVDQVIFPSVTFRFRGDKISEVRVVMSEDGAAALSRASSRVMAWMREKYPGELAGLMPGGRRVYSAEAAAKWLRLLKEWREERPWGASRQ